MSSFRIWHLKLLRPCGLANKILIQTFESRPTRIDLVVLTITIFQVQVSAAFFAQTLAIIFTKELLRQIKQYLLSGDLHEVDLTSLDRVNLHIFRMKLEIRIALELLGRSELQIKLNIERPLYRL